MGWTSVESMYWVEKWNGIGWGPKERGIDNLYKAAVAENDQLREPSIPVMAELLSFRNCCSLILLALDLS